MGGSSGNTLGEKVGKRKRVDSESANRKMRRCLCKHHDDTRRLDNDNTAVLLFCCARAVRHNGLHREATAMHRCKVSVSPKRASHRPRACPSNGSREKHFSWIRRKQLQSPRKRQSETTTLWHEEVIKTVSSAMQMAHRARGKQRIDEIHASTNCRRSSLEIDRASR